MYTLNTPVYDLVTWTPGVNDSEVQEVVEQYYDQPGNPAHTWSWSTNEFEGVDYLNGTATLVDPVETWTTFSVNSNSPVLVQGPQFGPSYLGALGTTDETTAEALYHRVT